MTTRVPKSDLDKCCDKVKGKMPLHVPEHGLRLARLQRAKFTETIQGRALKNWEYILVRFVQAHLEDIKYPFLDMKCRAWELWVHPNGRVCVRLINPMVGDLVLENLEYDIGHAPVE